MDEFQSPSVEMGQIVLWSQDGGASKTPALVVKVGMVMLSLAVFADGYTTILTRDGVRHKDDPDRRRGNNHEAGFWELTPRDIKINQLLDAGFFDTTSKQSA